MSDEGIRILFTGDLCPIGRVEELVRKERHDYVVREIMPELAVNDLNVADIECPLTNTGSERLKTGPHQKADPACIGLIRDAGIGLACLANNHILDYGDAGVADTLSLMNEYDISTVGIGSSLHEARKPASFIIKGKRIAVYNMSDNEFLTTPGGSFVCNHIDPVNLFYDLSEARRDHDFIIVVAHAGNEFYELPSPRTRKLYRFIIDSGADAVISHHTHAFSGYEVYRSKPVFYGLGNFIYDWPGRVNTRWNRGYMVRLLLSDKIGFDIIPLKQCDHEPVVTLMDKTERESFMIEIERLNSIIADDNLLEQEFARYCESVFHMYDAFIEPYFGRYVTALRKRGLFPRFLGRKKRLFLLNLSRCESHRDVLLRMLKKNE